MSDNFCHLHVHDEFSLLDGLGTPKQYLEKALANGFSHLAITNHGNIDGAIKLQTEAKIAGIKPIIGAELYIVPDIAIKEKGEKRKHVTILVKNQIGFENINKMLTIGYLEGFYYRARISPALLLNHCEGLVIMTACSSSFISEPWGLELFNELRKKEAELLLEIMPHKYKDQIAINQLALSLSMETGVPLVATNDCHYVSAGDEKAHEVLLAVQSKKKWNDPDRWKFDVHGLYLRTEEEMIEAFNDQNCIPEQEYRDAMENTMAVAEMCCNFSILQKEVDLPEVNCGYVDATDEEVLRELCETGFDEFVVADPEKNPKINEYRERLEEEFSTITKQGFTRYFLIIYELIDWCKRNGIMTGPGRGSSAGSLICFLLKITSADPILHKLLFARFISPARIDLPDIDMDFEDTKRYKIWDHFKETYGENNVAGVSTFSAMHGKGAIRDVSRVFDIPIVDVNAAASCIVVRSGGDFRSDFTLEDAFATFEDGRKFQKKYPEETAIAIRMEGQVRSRGQHAAAIVISKTPLTDGSRGYLLTGNKGDRMINWEKTDIEHMGLMKLDVLGLNALTILSKIKELVKTNTGKEIIYEKLPLNDEESYRKFSAGDTVGIFQFGSLGLRKFCKELGIDSFEMLTHANALFRPGTLRSGMATEFVLRRNGEKEWSYKHPRLEELTKDTFGVILYQEQVMSFMYDLGGLGWKTADTVRKVISKSQGVEQFMKFKEMFAEGCIKKGTLDKETAESLWDELASFGSYGFNRAHACVYSMIACWQMYAKVHYPLEFFCSSLTYGSEDKKEDLVEEAIRLEIDVRPPKVGKSMATEWVTDGENVLYCPFIEIKGIGDKTAFKLEEDSRKVIECEIAPEKKKGFFRAENKKEKVKISEKFKNILERIDSYNDISISEEKAEEIKDMFVFSFSKNTQSKYKNMLGRLKESLPMRKLSSLDYKTSEKNYSYYFGQMTEVKFGYRGKIDTLEKKLGISGTRENLGGVYGNFKDDEDFCMLVFGGEIYSRKKAEIEHCSGEYFLAKANHPSDRITSIQCVNAWFLPDILSCSMEGVGLNIIKKKSFSYEEEYDLQNCNGCELGPTCKGPVYPSIGKYNIMITGEAPGKDEDREGVGFYGRSGEMVWDYLAKERLSREDFHVTNICKCYPGTVIKTPAKKHIKSCRKWLDAEIERVNPVLILAFGNTSLEYFKGQDSGIMEHSGKTEWSEKNNAWICWCVHPASVLYHRENETLFNFGMDNFVRCIVALGDIK